MKLPSFALSALFALVLSSSAFACELCGIDHEGGALACPYTANLWNGWTWNSTPDYGVGDSDYGAFDMGGYQDGGYNLQGSLYSSYESYGDGTGSFYNDFGGGSFSGAYFGNGDMYIDGWWPGK